MTESDKDNVRTVFITGEELMSALADKSGSIPALQRMAARRAYEDAKRTALR